MHKGLRIGAVLAVSAFAAGTVAQLLQTLLQRKQ